MFDVLDSFLPGWRVWVPGLAVLLAGGILAHACDLEFGPHPPEPAPSSSASADALPSLPIP